MTQLALVEALFSDAWMRAHLRPRHKRIHVAARWLLVDKVKIVSELSECNLAAELSKRTIIAAEALLPGMVVNLAVHPRASAERPAHWNHYADLRLSFAPVTHEVHLLFRLGQIDVGYEIEVGTCGELPVVISHKNSSGSSFTTTDFAHRIAVVILEQVCGHGLHAVESEEGVADS